MTNKINEITLAAQLTSAEVEELFEVIKKITESNESLIFDGHLVEYIDFIGVQFLLTCQTKLSEHGETLLTNVSDTLRQSIIDIGALQLSQLAAATDSKAVVPE